MLALQQDPAEVRFALCPTHGPLRRHVLQQSGAGKNVAEASDDTAVVAALFLLGSVGRNGQNSPLGSEVFGWVVRAATITKSFAKRDLGSEENVTG